MNKYTYKCPLCKGSGKIIRKRQYDPQVRAIARNLYAKGYSLRNIGKIIHVNSAQSVKSLIMAKTL